MERTTTLPNASRFAASCVSPRKPSPRTGTCDVGLRPHRRLAARPVQRGRRPDGAGVPLRLFVLHALRRDRPGGSTPRGRRAPRRGREVVFRPRVALGDADPLAAPFETLRENLDVIASALPRRYAEGIHSFLTARTQPVPTPTRSRCWPTVGWNASTSASSPAPRRYRTCSESPRRGRKSCRASSASPPRVSAWGSSSSPASAVAHSQTCTWRRPLISSGHSRSRLPVSGVGLRLFLTPRTRGGCFR